MATTDQIIGNIDFIKNPISGLSMAKFQAILPSLLWIVLIGIFVFVMFKFMSHRINIEFFEKVKGGYVCSSGRYAVATDNKTKLEYLRPMMGNVRMPMFPLEAFHKVKGMPLIGIKRTIMLIKQNKYSYLVLLPTMDNTNSAIVEYHNTMSWMYHEEKRKFYADKNKEKLIIALIYTAPLVIIISAIVFFSVMIYLQMRYTHYEVQMLTELVNVAREVSR